MNRTTSGPIPRKPPRRFAPPAPPAPDRPIGDDPPPKPDPAITPTRRCDFGAFDFILRFVRVEK